MTIEQAMPLVHEIIARLRAGEADQADMQSAAGILETALALIDASTPLVEATLRHSSVRQLKSSIVRKRKMEQRAGLFNAEYLSAIHRGAGPSAAQRTAKAAVEKQFGKAPDDKTCQRWKKAIKKFAT